jgi:DNA-nicking Smr family endonuclease
MAEIKIDLHGLGTQEALRKLVRDYNAYVRSGGRAPVHIVHGYGSSGRGGAIQRAVREYITANRGRFDGVIEGEAFANPGDTIVYPRRLLPESRAGK